MPDSNKKPNLVWMTGIRFRDAARGLRPTGYKDLPANNAIVVMFPAAHPDKEEIERRIIKAVGYDQIEAYPIDVQLQRVYVYIIPRERQSALSELINLTEKKSLPALFEFYYGPGLGEGRSP